ncbi:MAG: ATP-dependent Clp protease proteolytic subunit [Oscillospiraceae bacterium]|nr:ATP-dependent Clp protease proteolytic subunit [Oscillospiraceae bacterium]
MCTIQREGFSMNEQQRETIKDLGSTDIKSSKGSIHCLTIVGQIEGHQPAPEDGKGTKYEHVLPMLAAVEESPEIDGLLIMLNTMGGDVEAGLAIAEVIAGMKKPTATLVLGGSHSIGVALAVAGKKSFIAPSAAMMIHPVRMTGMTIGAPQTWRYFMHTQQRITDFVTAHCHVEEAKFTELMMATDEIANDVGSILDGKQAVEYGLIDCIGSVSDALEYLHEEIDKAKDRS